MSTLNETADDIINKEIANKKSRIYRSEHPEQSLILDTSNFSQERDFEYFFKINIEVLFPQDPKYNKELMYEMAAAFQDELIPKISMLLDYLQKMKKKFEYKKDLDKMFGKTILKG